MDVLPVIWFIVIAVLWLGFLFLEGFDMGVGIHMKVTARNDKERRVMLNTIGPVWDGNEVWLVTAIGATFAAFPAWYAALLSAMYLPMLLILVGLIFRAVAFEYRGKVDNPRWRSAADWAIALGSLVVAAGIGATLGVTTFGLPIDANGDRVGGPFAGLSWGALLGAVAVISFCLTQGAAYLGLKTDGEVRHRAQNFLRGWLPWGLLPLLFWGIVITTHNANPVAIGLLVLAGIALLVVTYFRWRTEQDSQGLKLFLAQAVVLVATACAIFIAQFPVVLPSTLDSAYDLTVMNASSAPYTLGVMSIVAAFGVPLVLAYQGWTYWVFRQRISTRQIPAAHDPAHLAGANRVTKTPESAARGHDS